MQDSIMVHVYYIIMHHLHDLYHMYKKGIILLASHKMEIVYLYSSIINNLDLLNKFGMILVDL